MSEQPDPRTNRISLGSEVEPEHVPGPPNERQQPRAESEETGLAGSVGPLQEHDLSGVDPQRGAGQSWEPPDYRDRVLEPDGRIARSERFGVHADSTRYGSDGLARCVATPPVASPGVTEQLAAPVDGADAAPDSRTPDGKPPKPKQVSKWDRPPEPHDWRFFVGGVGKILIITGLLMFGFVAYQLWGTGIETARAQNKLENQFQDLVAESQTSTTAPATIPTTTEPTATVPLSTPETQPATTVERSTASSSVPSESVFPTTAPAPIEQDIPPIERGQVLAKLEIPKIGKDGGNALYVVPGVSHEDLKKGPGHYPDTPLPGQLGNASIAGHRTTFGEPFRHIDQLQPGDQITVTMFTGDRFVYEVASTEIVGPDDYFVVTTSDPTVAELTLTSCHPVYTARNRIAVHAFLVASDSDPVGEPTFYDLEANGNVGPARADDPAVRPESSEATQATESTGDVASVDTSSTESAESSEVAPTATTPEPTVPATAGQVEDAFGDGWFHDDGAWLQIALWGGALILIAIAIRKISRHFRHDSIGIAVGIIPFVVCLYFFYQNVNRLLPAAL